MLGPRPEVERELAERAAALAPELERFLVHHAGDGELGRELAQEALARALPRLAELRQPGALRGWLFRIGINALNDQLRQRRPQQELEAAQALSDPDPGTRPDRAAEGSEMETLLRRALHGLPERQRSILLLHAVQGVEHAEIARLLGISRGAVKAGLFHGRERLRQVLARHDGAARGGREEAR